MINRLIHPALAAAFLFGITEPAKAQNHPSASSIIASEPEDEEEATEEVEPDTPERQRGSEGFQVYDKFIRGNIDTSSVEVGMEQSGNVLFHIRCRRLEAIDPTALIRILENGAKGVPIPPVISEKSADPFSKINIEDGGVPDTNRWMGIVRLNGTICIAVNGQREATSSTIGQFFEGSISSSSVSVRQAFSNNRIVLIDCEELAPGQSTIPPKPEELAILEKQLAAFKVVAELNPKVERPSRHSPAPPEIIPPRAGYSKQSIFQLFINRTANWTGGVFGESAYSDNARVAGSKILDDWNGQILDESLDRSVTDNSSVNIIVSRAVNWQFLGASVQVNNQEGFHGTRIPELPPAEHILMHSLTNGGAFLRNWSGELWMKQSTGRS